ncbi:MAG: TMEM165/GDT1 family protein [Haloferacaceae archaeon]
MSTFIEVVIAAFTLQLLALPGEKGQLVIASLATKYNPYMVVGGAATAFGGWTAIEILLGNALEGALPEVYLDGATAGLFVVFAAWILYASTGEAEDPSSTGVADGPPSTGMAEGATSDGGVPVYDGFRSPDESRFSGFLPSFSLMVFGEFGDKTQLITIALAVQYGANPAIWVGEMLAIVPVSLATALFFHSASTRINQRWVHRVAAALFLLFAIDISAKYAIGTSLLPI